MAAPQDSSSVYCIDSAGGGVRWTVSKGLSPVFCGIYRGKAVLLGRNLRLLDISSGKEAAGIRIFRRNYFPLPFISGDLLWLSYPSSTAVFNLKTVQEVSLSPAHANLRMYPAYGCGIGEGENYISVYGYTDNDFSPETAGVEAKHKFVRSDSNCVALRSSLKRKIDKLRDLNMKKHPGPALRPVLWWMKRMNMKGASGVRGGSGLLVWSENCVRLIETELFGETVWERSFDPSRFHVKHVQNVGDRVFVLGSRKISCLDLSSGKEKWRISLPMYANALHYKKDKPFLYIHKHGMRSYWWRTGILNPENGSIEYIAQEYNRRSAIWDSDRMLMFLHDDHFQAFDIQTRKLLWKLKMETRWFSHATLFHSRNLKETIYMNWDGIGFLIDPESGAVLFRDKWTLIPWIWQAYGEPYAYHGEGVKRYTWDRKKKKLQQKWHTGIKDFDSRRIKSHNIIGDNLAVFGHGGGHYMELTQLDRETGKIKRRDELLRVPGGYHTLRSPQWSGNSIFILSDRMLYCFRFPSDKKGTCRTEYKEREDTQRALQQT